MLTIEDTALAEITVREPEGRIKMRITCSVLITTIMLSINTVEPPLREPVKTTILEQDPPMG